MPTVLIWNQYFPPDTSATSALASSLAESFEARGWVVTRLRGNPSYRPTSTRAWRFGQLITRQGNEWTVRSTHFSRDRMVGRVMNYLTFIGLSFVIALRSRADLIVAMTDPPIVVMPAVLVGRLRRTPVLYWLQDYLPDFLVGIGAARRSLPIRLWAKLHILSARRCRRVIAIGRDMAARLGEAGVDKDRIRVIPNGSALDWEARPLPDSPTENRRTERISVLHAGEIGMRGAWDVIGPAAFDFADVADLLFVGDGVESRRVRALTEGASNVEFREPVPRSEMSRVLLSADVLVVTVRRGAEGYTVPSKTYELLGAARPIIVVADSRTEPAMLVTELGCGLVASPDAPDEFQMAVRRLALDPVLRRAFGEAALEASPRYARHSLLGAIVDVASELIA